MACVRCGRDTRTGCECWEVCSCGRAVARGERCGNADDPRCGEWRMSAREWEELWEREAVTITVGQLFDLIFGAPWEQVVGRPRKKPPEKPG